MTTLSELFGGQYRSRILELLFLNPEESYHLRGIAARTGVPPASLHALLPKLLASGIIRTADAAKTKRYRANLALPGAADMIRFMSHYSLPTQRLQQVATAFGTNVAVAVFGSYASGTARMDSDIDVLVVGKLSRVEAQAAFKSLSRELARTINVTALKPEEFRRQAQEPASFVAEVISKPVIVLQGDLDAVANA